MPAEATGVTWYVLWSFDGAQRFVEAKIELPSSEPAFTSGTVVDAPSGDVRQGGVDTVGKFVEGPDGVISIDIPAELGGEQGKSLTATLADTNYTIGIPGVLSSLQPVDDATGKAYAVGACDGAPAAAPPAPAPSAPAPPATREVAAGKLDAKVSSRVPKARKVKRSLSLSLTSTAGISGVDAALFQGAIGKNRIVAKGRLASAKGSAKLKLKVSKKLKKGSYTLYLVGKNADGKVADKSVKLKFK